MDTGTAVPSNVNLAKQKPYAVSAYSRRVKSLANNAQSFGPNSYVNITLDTSTPGSFLDPLQSYLKFDLRIQNSNPFIDYVSFGQAGAASLIEEFRIYVQGTPIEEILQYNVFYETAMCQNGQCQQPFHLFRPSTIRQPVSDLFHLNAIKSPMLDISGRPMYGTLAAGNEGPCVSYSSTVPLRSLSLLASQSSYSAKVISTGALETSGRLSQSVYRFAGAEDASKSVVLTAPDSNYYLGANKAVPAGGAYTGGIGNTAGDLTDSGMGIADFVDNINLGSNLSYPDSTSNAFNLSSAGSGFGNGPMSNMPNFITIGGTALNNSSIIDNSEVSFQSIPYGNVGEGFLPKAGSSIQLPGNTTLRADRDPMNALNWPFLMPAPLLRPDLKTLGPDNLQDYFMFFANTKYIPVGLEGSKRASDSTGIPAGVKTDLNFMNVQPVNTPAEIAYQKSSVYTCCVPLISGVLGSFAEKCWPTMLVAPGSMYIQWRTATAEKAFRVSMDPCRRVLGTIRDYLPFGGSLGGLFGQYAKASTKTFANQGDGSIAFDSTITTADQGSTTSVNSTYEGCIPVGLNMGGTYPGGTDLKFTGAQDTETVKQQDNSSAAIEGIGAYDPTAYGVGADYVNCYCCIGMSTISSASRYFPSAPETCGMMFRPFSVAAMEGRWTIGKTYVNTSINVPIYETGAGYLNSYIPSIHRGSVAKFNDNPSANSRTVDQPLGVLSSAPAADFADFVAIPNAASHQCTEMSTVYGNTLNGYVTHELAPAGIPLPQYYLHAQPWRNKNFYYTLEKNPVDESRYILAAGAQQTNPCSQSTACYGSFLPSSVAQARRCLTHTGGQLFLSYTVENIEFVSQQIILPDTVSSQILTQAASGDISITANSVHNYQTPVSISSSQNLIIPAKIAAANTMYCLFQPQTFVTGINAPLYNSLRGVNPFGAVYLDSGITPNAITTPGFASIGYEAGALNVRNVPASGAPFQIQLKLGNELIPQQPIVNLNELLTENLKSQHKMFDTLSNINSNYALSTFSQGRIASHDPGAFIPGLSYNVLQPDTFATTFVPVEFLEDQTIFNNPANAFVYSCDAVYNNDDESVFSDYEVTRLPSIVSAMEPPESTFVIAFDMDTWSRYSDVTRSGKYLGNNTITLTLNNAYLLGLPDAQCLAGGFTLQTFVVHDIRFSFQAGGSVVSYY